MTFEINLSSIGDVKTFVTAAGLASCDIDVRSGRYLVDAKSIMGLFSLDLTKPVTVEVHGSEEAAQAFKNSVSALIA